MAAIKLPLHHFPFNPKQQNQAYPFEAKRYGSGKKRGSGVYRKNSGQELPQSGGSMNVVGRANGGTQLPPPPPDNGTKGGGIGDTIYGNIPSSNTTAPIPSDTSPTSIKSLGTGSRVKKIGGGIKKKSKTGKGSWKDFDQSRDAARVGPEAGLLLDRLKKFGSGDGTGYIGPGGVWVNTGQEDPDRLRQWKKEAATEKRLASRKRRSTKIGRVPPRVSIASFKKLLS